MNYSIKRAEWRADKSRLRDIRSQVFIDEQQVPQHLEWDEHDEDAFHWLAYAQQQAIGTCRMLANGHIGRMAVLKEYRGKGVGFALLQAAIAQAKSSQLFETWLNAQTHAVEFYQRAGFKVYGAPFLDANIPHRAMRLQLSELRLLGQHGGNFAISDLKQSSLELIQQTTRQLRILSDNLDRSVYDNSEMVELISSLARHSRHTEIKILVMQPSLIAQGGHRLLNLQRRLSSTIFIRKCNALPHEVKNNLILADHTGIICQSMTDHQKVWGNFNNKPVVANYIAQFDDLWERGSEDSNLRQLDL